jgi:ABC-type siderophore export system fused ATPase/permease subunit
MVVPIRLANNTRRGALPGSAVTAATLEYVRFVRKSAPAVMLYPKPVAELATAMSVLQSIIGHSGCGKSTLLNIIAGLTRATEGYVFLNNRAVGPCIIWSWCTWSTPWRGALPKSPAA